jgi:adsorption protein B
MDATAIQIIGLIVTLAFIVFGIDDFLWDAYVVVRNARGARIDSKALDKKPPKMLAITIAAWHEDAVLGDVVGNLVESANYPQDMYRVFLGVYPNDPATIAVASALAAKYRNVVKIVNVHDGPTSKADNLNHVMHEIIAYEKAHNLRFAGITIHDSEDVIHPLELKMTNLLIDDYDALQFPVFPLMKMPRFGNFFQTITAGTYADEFAEHHFRTLVIRDRYSFVPSAGTGFCLRRSFLDTYGDGQGTILPQDSLTEDYKLSLSMHIAGYRVHYVLERVPRVGAWGRRSWDYIATRSMFPRKFKLAVRQKTRWMYGITMQSASLHDVFADNGLGFNDRAFLYKDLKSKFSNFVLLPGYLVFAYFIVQIFIPQLPVMYPYLSFEWWLCVFLLIMMVERQFMRARAIANVYGRRMMFFACLFPPLFPIRLIWGNVINLCATFNAWRQKATFDRAMRQARAEETAASCDSDGEPPVESVGISAAKDQGSQEAEEQGETSAQHPEWTKTDHEFLSEDVLKRYRRRYGDFLLTETALDEGQLEEALENNDAEGAPLGERLLENGLITEGELADATAAQNGTVHIAITPELQLAMARWDAGIWQETGIWPILETAQGYLAVSSDRIGPTAARAFAHAMGKCSFMLVAETSELDLIAQAQIDGADEEPNDSVGFDELQMLCDEHAVTLAQAGIALGYALNDRVSATSVLQTMGLLA